jgi:hypothetical protein
MPNNESYSFMICDELALRLRALRFDPNAEPQTCILPLASIFWHDEWPDGRPRIRCHDECDHAFLRLVAARAEFWRSEQIPTNFQALWDQAKEIIPDWPGFERMFITEDQRRAIAECEGWCG